LVPNQSNDVYYYDAIATRLRESTERGSID